MKAEKRIRIITGHYGSGKTEFALNYAIKLKDMGKKVAIADLDVVNPYFRSRECENLLEEKKIELLGFIIKEHGMDLPAVSGNVMKGIRDESYDYVVDLGGDGAGARAFGSFRKSINPDQCELLFVINAYRPETMDLMGVLAILKEVEGTLNMKVTGLVNNTHLLWETKEEDILVGEKLVCEVSKKIDVPIKYTAIKRELIKDLKNKVSGEILPIDMLMRKSWM
ncbi:MAG: hypothetical protein ACRC6A_13050 [Fusobacteriaceae bacterium]